MSRCKLAARVRVRFVAIRESACVAAVSRAHAKRAMATGATGGGDP
jgi:hypothetical protein